MFFEIRDYGPKWSFVALRLYRGCNGLSQNNLETTELVEKKTELFGLGHLKDTLIPLLLWILWLKGPTKTTDLDT